MVDDDDIHRTVFVSSLSPSCSFRACRNVGPDSSGWKSTPGGRGPLSWGRPLEDEIKSSAESRCDPTPGGPSSQFQLACLTAVAYSRLVRLLGCGPARLLAFPGCPRK